MTTPPHPITPPLSRDEEIASLRLLRSRRVGPVTWFRLVREHGSPAAALQALPDIAAKSGVSGYEPCPIGVAEAELAAGSRIGARLLAYGSADYPADLARIEDAPPLIWVKGNADLLARPAVAVIGARDASSLGLRMARGLARGLAEAGQVVVSGLARGIDSEAHRAALQTGTIAVLAGGIDQIYPPENAKLQGEIASGGLLVTEQPFGLAPQARHFPQRNRLVSGLSRAVVVVEAASGSGSLITAKLALDQGREVLAVPGHPMDPRASGCNRLIREGALLVRSAEDVIEALNGGFAPQEKASRPTQKAQTPPIDATPKPASAGQGQGTISQRILDLLATAPLGEDQLVRDLGLSVPATAAELTILELEGLVERRPGGILARVY